jgi:hypothetical protein
MVRLHTYRPHDSLSLDEIEFPAGLALPPVVMAMVPDLDGHGVEAKIIYDGERYVCAELRMWQLDGGPPVTGEAIRAVPVKHLVRRAIRMQLYEPTEWDDRGWESRFELMPAAKPPPDAKRHGTDEMARWVAQVYQLAVALNEPPTKTVQDELGVSRATAGRWVAEARERGLLPPVPAREGDR